MKVYILYGWTTWEGEDIINIFSTNRKAHVAELKAQKNKEYEHYNYFEIREYELK